MSTRKICVCVMSRANYGRLKSVIEAIINHPGLELQLILGASFYNANIGIEPDARIQCLINSDDHEAMAITTGVLLPQMAHEFTRLKPDIVLVHGDRYEVLACAIAASYMNIPLAHTEGGEVTGCIDDKVRNAITALADIHFPVTYISKNSIKYQKRIIGFSESSTKGLNTDNVYVVGSPAIDNLVEMDLSNNRKEPYMLVLHHPNTTEKEDITPLIEALKEINMHKVWVNPNVDAGNKQMLKIIHEQDVEFVKDLPPEEYYRLLANCECAVGNSSSFIKEGAFLGTPCVIVGKRQQNREHGKNVVFVNYDKNEIQTAIFWESKTKHEQDFTFGMGAAGKAIAQILSKIQL